MADYTAGIGSSIDSSTGKNRSFDDYVIRLSDIVFSVLGLIALTPMFTFLAALIKMESPGEVFFKGKRIGENGKCFRMYKFRSMCQNADKMTQKYRKNSDGSVEPVVKMKNDTRITRIGKYIRPLGLDELPQLINVIKGDMSLVGPRAPILSEYELYSDYHKQRLKIKPGITGLAQVNGGSNLEFESIVKYDIDYIKNRSIKLYFKIVLRTIPFLLLDNGNY
ncbi:sugar transferase [Candidatus Poribacteria bacterium]|nr:sugar transferase [Candidatus Poribacteria bacterium]